MASNTSAKASVKDVLLTDQSTWDPWYETIKSSVPEPLWKYFDPDGSAVYLEPIEPIELVRDQPQETPASSSGHSTQSTQTLADTPDQQAARAARYKENMDIYFKQYQIYQGAKRDWTDYHTVTTKLRDKIQGSVAKQKAAKLRESLPVRTWLKELKAATASPEKVIKRSISVDYRQFMDSGFQEWPTGGPSAWLTKWEDLICRGIHLPQKFLVKHKETASRWS